MLPISQLSILQIGFPHIQTLLPGIFFIALLVTAIMSGILLYHWFRYGKYAIKARKVATVYMLGVVFFLLLMGIGM